MIKLLILDGDNTLWLPLSGVCCSDVTPDDAIGNPDFAYAPAPGEEDMVVRGDGARFQLAPGARQLVEQAYRDGVRLAICSWNHAGNIDRILAAFGIRDRFSQVVAEWHTDKASMMRKILAAEAREGRRYEPAEVLFVDDDPEEIYRSQAAGLGINFARMGHPEEAADWAAVERLVRAL